MTTAVAAYTLTPGRLVATIAALLARAGVIIAGLALARPAGPRQPTIALAGGLIGLVVGGLVVALAKGGPGTGYGIVGGFFAIGFGLIAAGLGWLALVRARRHA